MKKMTYLMMLALGISAVSSNINANLKETKDAKHDAKVAADKEYWRHKNEMQQYLPVSTQTRY
jgi:hypothetical protein